ncbi:MAG: prolipoprotein diacylglyceryl transferase [Spirochaetes bacterium]|nr:prolipoprotein diacylglyceryl transferase [Spirochaetota bacterium]
MPAFLNYPSWLRPEIVPGLPMRWYGLMYVVAFAVAYFLFRYQAKTRKLGFPDDDVSGFFGAAILGLLVGARIFYVIFYDPSGTFLRMPWLAVLPFDENWKFIGYSGLSFHGGFLGVLAGTIIYAKRRKLDYLQWADMTAVSVPLGYTFGRLGNFWNGELWGKVTASPFGMVFPRADAFRATEPWVRRIMEEIGMVAQSATVNLPRHPSQLYEALFEGLILWLLLWFVVRPRMPWKGFASGAWIAGYGFVRFFIEYFREPDAQLGYVLPLADPDASIHLLTSPWNFSMGQILCLLMIAGGVAFAALTKRYGCLAEPAPGEAGTGVKRGNRKTEKPRKS